MLCVEENKSRMEQDATKAESDYFGLAEKWDEELYGKLKRDRLIAIIVAAVACALTALSIIAVMMLTPLKTVEPYMILVDKTTGHSEAVRRLVYNEANPLTGQESIVLSEINNYIIARNTYDVMDASRRFLDIRMSTSSDELRRYNAQAARDNNRFNNTTRRLVSIKSIVPNLSKKTAQVRYSTTIENGGVQTGTKHWIVTLKYDFVRLDMPIRFRHLNPLGFLVTEYRADPEMLQ